jgi:hypothetical protein
MGSMFSCCKKNTLTEGLIINEFTCITCGKKFLIYKKYVKHKNKCNRTLEGNKYRDKDNRQRFIC